MLQQNKQNSFTIDDIANDSDVKEYKENIKKLASTKVNINKEDPDNPSYITSRDLQQTLPSKIYQKYCNTYEHRKIMLEYIKSLHPDFGSLELQHQPRKKSPKSRLINFPDGVSEAKIIDDYLLNLMVNEDYDPEKRLPKGSIDELANKINYERAKHGLYKRSRQSIKYHVRKALNGEIKIPYKIATRGPKPKKDLGTIISDEISDLSNMPIADINGKVIYEFRSFGTESHQGLLAYMIHPENYKQILGQDAELKKIVIIGADLRDDIRPMIDRSDSYIDDEHKVSEDAFYCELIYKNRGRFIIANIKERVRKHNMQQTEEELEKSRKNLAQIAFNRNFNEKTSYHMNPKGVIVAYDVDKSLKDKFQHDKNYDAIEIPYSEMENFMLRALGKK